MKIFSRKFALHAFLLCTLLGCATEKAEPQEAAQICSAPQLLGRLPAQIREASGIAASLRHPGVWWILVDEPPPVVMAIDSTGRILATVRVAGAHNTDWESLTSGNCGSGSCLYIGDIGDNERARPQRTVYRIPEPDLRDGTVNGTAFSFQYPNARYDAEALFVLPGEQLHVVTKGRGEPITVFKYPGALDSTRVMQLQPMQTLSQGLVQFPQMVTGAGATPDGKWIVLRTYSWLQLYTVENGFLVPQLPGQGVDLGPLGQLQGEGVDIAGDGRVLLITEQGPGKDGVAPVGLVRCTLKSGS